VVEVNAMMMFQRLQAPWFLGRDALPAAVVAAGLLLMLSITGCTSSTPATTLQEQEQAVSDEPAAAASGEKTQPARAAADGEDVANHGADSGNEGDAKLDPADLAKQWGIEVTSIRLTANNYMIDFRYRVLDPVKAKELFVRQNKPALVHQKTGKVLVVPETAKIGPLRNSDDPKQGKIYWMFFGNAGGLVKTGDQVTVVIGDFRAEDLVVE
jgi:hypothetical protein